MNYLEEFARSLGMGNRALGWILIILAIAGWGLVLYKILRVVGIV